jgi:hypothetical protein
MSFALPLVLAAVAAQAPLPAQPQQHGAAVSARATVVILRSGDNSEKAGAEGPNRHVSRPEAGRVTIAFE